jgi:hypothetical protein
VLVQQFQCGPVDFRNRYVDFTGREWDKSELSPAVRYMIVDYLEEALGIDIDLSAEIELIEAAARYRGLI